MLIREVLAEELPRALAQVRNGSPWLDSTEAAEYLRMSEAAVRQRAQRGTLPSHKDEGRWLFHRDELDSALGFTRGS